MQTSATSAEKSGVNAELLGLAFNWMLIKYATLVLVHCRDLLQGSSREQSQGLVSDLTTGPAASTAEEALPYLEVNPLAIEVQ